MGQQELLYKLADRDMEVAKNDIIPMFTRNDWIVQDCGNHKSAVLWYSLIKDGYNIYIEFNLENY